MEDLVRLHQQTTGKMDALDDVPRDDKNDVPRDDENDDEKYFDNVQSTVATQRKQDVSDEVSSYFSVSVGSIY